MLLFCFRINAQNPLLIYKHFFCVRMLPVLTNWTDGMAWMVDNRTNRITNKKTTTNDNNNNNDHDNMSALNSWKIVVKKIFPASRLAFFHFSSRYFMFFLLCFLFCLYPKGKLNGQRRHGIDTGQKNRKFEAVSATTTTIRTVDNGTIWNSWMEREKNGMVIKHSDNHLIFYMGIWIFRITISGMG